MCTFGSGGMLKAPTKYHYLCEFIFYKFKFSELLMKEFRYY